MEQEFKLALCQILTEENKQETLDKAERMIRDAAEHGARVVAFPEMFACPYSHPYFRPYAETEGGPTVQRMSYWAREYGVILIGGSIPELEKDTLYNTCFVFDEEGNRIARHRKDHLFDISLQDGTYFRESDSFARGNDICVFDTSCGRMGVAICFDVRFPELIRAMALQGARLIVLPAQFTVSTGKAHWETTMRAGQWTMKFILPPRRRHAIRAKATNAGDTLWLSDLSATSVRRPMNRSRLFTPISASPMWIA